MGVHMGLLSANERAMVSKPKCACVCVRIFFIQNMGLWLVAGHCFIPIVVAP